ncbi:uncharacterized protein LOC129757647 isoform X2 [Uranotaenia lowii]|uniref:uncharacterized protein LOC129757647 isoform X2 n=1 Tax=Uranotaenia lowii TaxID=190385 RepID=UPI0024791A2A|nr:uncharacterized protein LOC129757647 isoform X2 [Uranotaenia lowii]
MATKKFVFFGCWLMVAVIGDIAAGKLVLKSSLRQLAWEAKDFLVTCSGKNGSRWDCLWEQSLNAVDEFANSANIPLISGVSLVRVKNVRNQSEEAGPSFNETDSGSVPNRNKNKTSSNSWTGRVVNALDHMFRTHVLQIDLLNAVSGDGGFNESDNDRRKDAAAGLEQRINRKNKWWMGKFARVDGGKDVVEGRHRHRRHHQVIPMMIFGVTVFGMFAVPIGFQFLAALGGKAFLMAKLALLLASINSLKRVRML